MATGQPAVSGPSPDVLRWLPQVRSAATKHGVEVPVILAFIDIESSGNPRAVSVSGARGLMQLMPRFWLKQGEDPELLFDPVVNVDRGTGFVSALRKKWGTTSKAAAAYFGMLDLETGVIRTDKNNPSGLSGTQYVHLFWRAFNRYRDAA
jgi:hypothetical protein